MSVPGDTPVDNSTPSRLDVLDHVEDLQALLEREPVDEELAVEMVDLVLEGAREQALAGHLPRLAVLVEGAHGGLGEALELGVDAGDGEAALLVLERARRRDLLGVD